MSVIQAYIENQPPELQERLQKLYHNIKKVAPMATERIAYRMPSFYIDKTFLCGFAVFKKHISFFPGGEPVGVFADKLKKYKTSKGTVQFPIDEPIDYKIVQDMIKYRLST